MCPNGQYVTPNQLFMCSSFTVVWKVVVAASQISFACYQLCTVRMRYVASASINKRFAYSI